MSLPWSLECSHCEETHDGSGLPTLCPGCGLPWLVRYANLPLPAAKKDLLNRSWNMWRYREWMPLQETEEPVSLGEGMTPLIRVRSIEKRFGIKKVFVKDEGQNPCGSFKSRGLSAAVTRAVLAGAKSFVIPTAGNAGVALSAYGRAAGTPVRVYAPASTPPLILDQMRLYGAHVETVEGHIGDCGKASKAHAAESGAMDMSTLKEPYRIEGKKTLGLELAEQMNWELPDCIVYPTGGGTGLIGMWKAFHELADAEWLPARLPRMVSVQATGCAPVVKAFRSGAVAAETWEDPKTVAAGLRVPGPIGGRIMMSLIRETEGNAVAVDDDDLVAAAAALALDEGIDACPEGGATVSALGQLKDEGTVGADDTVVLFNTGAGWLYR
jgi:threonine synthase